MEITDNNKNKESEKIRQQNQILKAQNLCSEIDIRCESLENKFDQTLSVLSDYQVLVISKDKSYDIEFNDILEKITILASLVEIGGDAAQSLLDNAIWKRNLITRKRKDFLGNLQSVLLGRDITPDKLKNASILRVDIPKFSGYDSRMDFFTFKSEFRKLIEPTVQKKYWADFLKRNDLCGVALTLG